jgi:hypothetical protein
MAGSEGMTPGMAGSPEGGAGAAAAGPDPIQNRYVDNKTYQPLPADKVRSAATTENLEEAYLAVAKRMPVRMQVKMDQRKLNKFLIECGNADLMLEVKQVRINPAAPDIFSMSGSSGRGGEGTFGGGRSGFGGRSFGGEGGAGAAENDGKYPWDVVVEVYGIMYIFNPPSITRLEAKLEPEEVAKFKEAIKAAEAKPEKQPPAAGDAAPADAKQPPQDTAPPTDGNKAAPTPPPADAARTKVPLAPAG